MSKKTVVFAVALSGAIMFGTSGCASCSRMGKDIQSDWSGGLERTVTVYDINGNVVKRYSGKMDLDRNGSTTKFDIYEKDGTTRRVIIDNPTGITISEER